MSGAKADVLAVIGKFGHHPDPAIDFCIEVEALENEVENHRIGFTNGTPSLIEVTGRIERALSFRVGGDESAVQAKQALRGIAAKQGGAA